MNIDKSLIFKKAIFIRELENFFLEMFSKGLLNGTVHTCVGQELIPVVVSNFLNKDDKIFSNHRGHGHYIASNNPAKDLILELMGDADGISKGIGGSQHIYSDNFISNGIQGGLAPVCVGFSYIQKIKKTENISVCYTGDGTLGEGQFYEALTLAAIFKSPSLFIVENNQYAQSTSNKYTLKGSLSKRIEGFDIKYYKTNIWDIDDLNKVVENAIKHTREGEPCLLEIDCYRLNSHSKGDDNRNVSEIEKYKQDDLINKYIDENLDWYKVYQKQIKEEFNNIVDEASLNDISIKQLENVSLIKKDIELQTYKPNKNQEKLRQNELINKSLDNVLRKYNALIIGEDILDSTPHTPLQYGGAFKVTKGLSSKYPELVHNTSISEAGITGFGIGSALNGNPCIVEIMFGDFMTLCVDQIVQQASKIPSMYGQKIDLPLIIRTPMGGRRGYGPTHSQNIEKLFLFWPNINVLAINSLNDINSVYDNAIKSNKTTIIIEDKVSYTKRSIQEIPLGYKINQSNEIFPTYFLEPDFSEPNLLIVTYGSMFNELFEILPELIDEEIFPLIITPTNLSPLNLSIFDRINFKNMTCVFIEEGSKRSAWSSEVISSLLEAGSQFKKVHRISNEHVIPCSKNIEEKIFPSKINLVEKIKKI